jgi:hypothetical protein
VFSQDFDGSECRLATGAQSRFDQCGDRFLAGLVKSARSFVAVGKAVGIQLLNPLGKPTLAGGFGR